MANGLRFGRIGCLRLALQATCQDPPPTMLLRDQIECKLLTVLSVSRSISATIGPEPSVFIGNWGFPLSGSTDYVVFATDFYGMLHGEYVRTALWGMVDIYAQLSTTDWPK